MKLIQRITRWLHRDPEPRKPTILTVTFGPKRTLDFDQLVDELARLSAKAQVTFLYRLVARLPITVVKTLEYYTRKRLEQRDNDSNLGQKFYNTAGKASSAADGIS